MRNALAACLLLTSLSGCGLAETGAAAAGGAAAQAQQAAQARQVEQRVTEQIGAADKVAEEQRRAAEAQAQ
ncbi:MAG: hypothetical protein ACHQD6_00470 [Steroidobacterales bacterium]|jgi:hypothetical protein